MGYYHEIFNEVGRAAVFADLAAWLAEHVPAGAGGGEVPGCAAAGAVERSRDPGIRP